MVLWTGKWTAYRLLLAQKPGITGRPLWLQADDGRHRLARLFQEAGFAGFFVSTPTSYSPVALLGQIETKGKPGFIDHAGS